MKDLLVWNSSCVPASCRHIQSWCALLVLLTAPLAVASQPIVRSISAEENRVIITLSASASFTQAALPSDSQRNLGDRCYVDIFPAVLDITTPRYVVVDSGSIKQVRAAQFRASTTRVVLDLAAAQPCRVEVLTDPDRLQIAVANGGETRASAPPEITPKAETVPATDSETSAPETSALATPVATAEAAPPVDTSSHREASKTESEPDKETLKIVFEARSPHSSRPTQESGQEIPSRIVPLEEAYQLAVANEEQVAIAARELAKAQLLPWRAIALMTPRGEVAGAYTRNKNEISFVQEGANLDPARQVFGTTASIRPQDTWRATFSVTQPLFEPSFFPSWRLGKDAVHEGEQRYDFIVREVLFGVAQAYYEVLRFRAQVKIAQDTLNLAREELRRAQARFRVGEVTKTDVLRAEVSVERAERALVVDRNRLKLARTVLARTIGLSEVVGVMEPVAASFSRQDYAQLLEQAYDQRQDLRAQKLAIQVQQGQKNIVLARYFPQVDARFAYPRLDPETFADQDEYWSLFVNLRWSIFDGGSREIDLQEANENLSQAKLRVGELKKEIRVEVREALLTVETLQITLEMLKKEVDLAQENYDVTSKQYRVGLSTSLDINTSLNALNQARTQLADQTYAYQVALLSLDNTVGVFAQDYVPQR